MEKITGNFLTQANKDFPLDCETLDYLQKLSAIAAIAGNIGGDRIVLTGCEPNSDGTRRNAGYVFVRTSTYPEGEVLPWDGGSTTNGMYLKQESLGVSANNTDYPKAYTRRSLAPGLGDETFSWEDFTDLLTVKSLMNENKKLRDQIASVQPPPPGIIQLWAGVSVPDGYVLCNGQELKQSDYPALHKALGGAFNSAVSAGGVRYTTQKGYFRVPDLRGRFVVGQHDSDDDYKTAGMAAGAKKIALTADQLPEHAHEVKDYYYAESKEKAKGNYDRVETNGKIGSHSTDSDNDCLHYYKHNTASAGAGATHENRPPYYVLAYVMRAE